jgi:tetratricopeptide (TPR) repeat protein
MARLTQRFGLTRYEADEYYKKALEAYRKNQLEEALVNMNEAIALLPNNPEYYAARGFFYLEDGVKEKARTDFEQAIILYPYEMLAHYGRGIIAYGDKNWDEALAYFKDAHIANPNRPETLYYLALTYHRKGEHMQALPLMEQARANFEGADDKRKADAARWVRELERLAGQKVQAETLEPAFKPLIRRGQMQLPLGEEEEKEE